jgi:carboxyl-terminal processing protease
LKKENIDGLILDLRNNGGGSAEEATELAGIFIDAGPVQQEKDRDGKVYTLKDVNRGTIYDGPLVILVNGYSASASEIVAGALQDYNRAVIVGASTYGKATAQIVFPMDTTVTPETLATRQSEDYLKITISKLYRVTGTTAQFSGVHPDIVLPDLLDAYISKEADDPFALRPTTIQPNKYYTPYPPLPLKTLVQSVQTEIDTNRYFRAVKSFVAEAKTQKAARDISLNLNDAIAAEQAAGINEAALSAAITTKKFSIQSDQYEIARMQSDSYLKELNDEFSQQVLTDPYIGIAYDVLGKLKSP